MRSENLRETTNERGQAVIEFALIIGSVIALFAITHYAYYSYSQSHLARMLVAQQAQLELQNSSTYGDRASGWGVYKFGVEPKRPAELKQPEEFYKATAGEKDKERGRIDLTNSAFDSGSFDFPSPVTTIGLDTRPLGFIAVAASSKLTGEGIFLKIKNGGRKAAFNSFPSGSDWKSEELTKTTWSFYDLRDRVNAFANSQNPFAARDEATATTVLYYSDFDGDPKSRPNELLTRAPNLGSVLYLNELFKTDGTKPPFSSVEEAIKHMAVGHGDSETLMKGQFQELQLAYELEENLQAAIKALENQFGDVDQLIERIQSMQSERVGSLSINEISREAKAVARGVDIGHGTVTGYATLGGYAEPSGAYARGVSGFAEGATGYGRASRYASGPQSGVRGATNVAGGATGYARPAGFAAGADGFGSVDHYAAGSGGSGDVEAFGTVDGHASTGGYANVRGHGSTVGYAGTKIERIEYSYNDTSTDGDSGHLEFGDLSSGSPLYDSVSVGIGAPIRSSSGHNSARGVSVDSARWKSSRAIAQESGKVLSAVGSASKSEDMQQMGTALASLSGEEEVLSEDGARKKKKWKRKKRTKQEIEAEEKEQEQIVKEMQRLEVLGYAVTEKETRGDVSKAKDGIFEIASAVKPLDPHSAVKLENLGAGLAALPKNFSYIRELVKKSKTDDGKVPGPRAIEELEIAALDKVASDSVGMSDRIKALMEKDAEFARKMREIADRFKSKGPATGFLKLQTALSDLDEDPLFSDSPVQEKGEQNEVAVKNWIRELDQSMTGERIIYVSDPMSLKRRVQERIEYSKEYLRVHPYGDATSILLKRYTQTADRFLSTVKILSISEAKEKLSKIGRKLVDLYDPSTIPYKRDQKMLDEFRKQMNFADPESFLSKTVSDLNEAHRNGSRD